MASHEYTDDPTIGNGEIVLRRIPLQPGTQIIWDNNLGSWRPSSAAFKDHPNGTPMSVSLQKVLENKNLPIAFPLQGYETTHALAQFSVQTIRQLGLGIERRPLSTDPSHAEVFGPKKKAVCRALARAAEWALGDPLPPPTKTDGPG